MNPKFRNPTLHAVIICTAIILTLTACGSGDSLETDSVNTGNSATSDSLQVSGTFASFSDDAVLGANVYVPVYSHIYQLNQNRTFNLTATLSIRNTDLDESMIIKKVYYYDSNGDLVHKYLDDPQSISALSSTSFVVEEEDLRGGVGANFLVLWESTKQISEPIIEAVMISTSQQQGISFISHGRIIDSLDQTSQ